MRWSGDGWLPYLASRTLLSSSRNAISVAFAVSASSDILCRWSSSAFCMCRETSLRMSGVFAPSARDGVPWLSPHDTSLNCCLGLATSRTSSSSAGDWASEGESSPATECFLLAAGVSDSLLIEPFGWRRVMPPRIFLISSTMCTPSGGLGFLGRM